MLKSFISYIIMVIIVFYLPLIIATIFARFIEKPNEDLDNNINI